MAKSKLSTPAPPVPVCSVCIANYNGRDIIAECIESVLDQKCGFPVEIIVHDDASTDGSAELIRTRFPQVRLIKSRKNVGFCVSNNRMAAVATGAYLLLLNNDAALMPEALNTLLNRAVTIGKPAILTLPQYNAATQEIIDLGCYLDPFLNPVPNLDANRTEVGMVIGACLWIPRKLWIELGGFPEWFGSLAEDMYLCCVARLAGYTVEAVAESGYRHHVGYSFGGGKPADKRLNLIFSRRSLSERNKNFVMVVTYPTIALVFLLPLHLLLLILEGVTLALLRLNPHILTRVYCRSIGELWHYRHKLLSERTYNQSRFKAGISCFFKPFTFWPHKIVLLIRYGLPK